MADQTESMIGTVAEEAARLIAAMATMARVSTVPSDDPIDHGTSPHADRPAQSAVPPHPQAPGSQDSVWSGDAPSEDASSAGGPTAGPGPAPACSACGGETDGTPVACKLCPLCQGIALLRSVRPETVERLADLATSIAASLRDVATQSRASGPAPDAGSRSDHATVQDIPVDDEGEGRSS